MISLEGVSTEYFEGVSFHLPAGAVCRIVLSSEYSKNLLLDVMIGGRRPEEGRVTLLGSDVYSLSGADWVKIFMEVGVVWKDGGMISNLKLWENIVLPIWHHRGVGPAEAEDMIRELYGLLGRGADRLSELFHRSPSAVVEHERRMAGLVRAALMEPRLMIYDSMFEGIGGRERGNLLDFVTLFHKRKEGRGSVFLTTDASSLEGIDADITLRQSGRSIEA